MMVGPKGSSKTTTILRLIYGNNKTKKCTNCYHKFYRHFFHKIYVFSPTWSNDAKTARCKIPDDQIFEDVEDYEAIIQEILDGQEEDIREDGKDEADDILLIFSDLSRDEVLLEQKRNLEQGRLQPSPLQSECHSGFAISSPNQRAVSQQPVGCYVLRLHIQPT